MDRKELYRAMIEEIKLARSYFNYMMMYIKNFDIKISEENMYCLNQLKELWNKEIEIEEYVEMQTYNYRLDLTNESELLKKYYNRYMHYYSKLRYKIHSLLRI